MTVSKKTCITVGVSAFLLFLCIRYWNTVEGLVTTAFSAATPILVGLSIAYVVNLLMSFYERHYFPKQSHKKAVSKSRRAVCLIGAVLTLCAMIALIVWLVVPKLVEVISFLIAEIPPLIESALQSEWLKKLLPAETMLTLSEVDWMAAITKMFDAIGSGLGDAVNAVVAAVTSVVSGVITVFLSIIFSVYLLYNKDTLQRQSRRVMEHYVPAGWQDRLFHWLGTLNDCFRGYIVGQCTEAVILGVLTAAGMLIFGFPYAGMVGALVGFLALVPIAGAYISAATGTLIMLTVSPLKALLFLVFIVVLQQLEGNLIYPKVVGKSLGLPAIWVLAAITIGGGLLGILGMLLGVPVAATLYRLVREDMERREKTPVPPAEEAEKG